MNYSYHCTDRGKVELSLVLLVDLSIKEILELNITVRIAITCHCTESYTRVAIMLVDFDDFVFY